VIEDLSMRSDRGCSKIVPCQAGLFVAKKGIEYFSTRSMLEGWRKFLEAAVPWKLVGKTERAGGNLRFDPRDIAEPITCPSAGFDTSGAPLHCRKQTKRWRRLRSGIARVCNVLART